MKSPFKKPGPTPDGLAYAQLKELDGKIAGLNTQKVVTEATHAEHRNLVREASFAAQTEPNEANIKRKAAAKRTLDETTDALADVDSALMFAKQKRQEIASTALSTAHKRTLNTVYRDLDKRDELATTFFETAQAHLEATHKIREANTAAFNALPQWPNESDNSFGLSPIDFERKLAHELYLIASSMRMEWPVAKPDSVTVDITMLLAERLPKETANVMERLRARPIVVSDLNLAAIEPVEA